MSKSKQILRTLATERGYTLEELADELEERGWDNVAAEGRTTSDAVHNPVHHSNPVYLIALEDILGVTREQTRALWRTMLEDVGEEVRGWNSST